MSIHPNLVACKSCGTSVHAKEGAYWACCACPSLHLCRQCSGQLDGLHVADHNTTTHTWMWIPAHTANAEQNALAREVLAKRRRDACRAPFASGADAVADADDDDDDSDDREAGGGSGSGDESERPVIYLYPPAGVCCDVTLQGVAPNFALQTLYPPPPAADSNSTTCRWTRVMAASDGLLTTGHTSSGSSAVPYLFWDATHGRVDDASPVVWRATVPVHQVQPRLTEAARALGLNPRELADFVTYWVPRVRRTATTDADAHASANAASAPDSCRVRLELSLTKADRVAHLFITARAPDGTSVPIVLRRLYLTCAVLAKRSVDGAPQLPDLDGVGRVPALERRPDTVTVVEWGGQVV